MLYDAYQKSGDRIKAKNIKELALKVAKDANRLDWVNNFWK
jgi:hypothetical protein